MKKKMIAFLPSYLEIRKELQKSEDFIVSFLISQAVLCVN